MSEWKSPVLLVASSLFAGAAALTEGSDQRLLAGSASAAGLVLIGVWIASSWQKDRD